MATFSLYDPAEPPLGACSANLVCASINFADRWRAPLVLLAIRLWMAQIFFRAGLLKIQNLDGAIFLFSDVHPVPLLAP